MWTITAQNNPNYLLRDLAPESVDQHDLLDDTTSRSQNKADEPIRCRTCSTPITSKDQAISKQKRHEHTFFNPSGIIFEIRCFQEAPGCLVKGEATAEFSWFSGYFWQYALCMNCLTHIGWFFTAGQDYFFALISQDTIP